MIPHPWPALVLALAAYRAVRLLGWDDFPPIARVRAWVVGEGAVSRGSHNAQLNLTAEKPEITVSYRRPLLDHFIHCPFCVGAWLSLIVYLAWLAEPRWTLYGAAPFALSGAVGLIAKNLDP